MAHFLEDIDDVPYASRAMRTARYPLGSKNRTVWCELAYGRSKIAGKLVNVGMSVSARGKEVHVLTANGARA